MFTTTRDVVFKTLSDAQRGAPVVAQIVKYYKETVGVELKVLRAVSGAPTRLRFVWSVDSLDGYYARQAKAAQDPVFQKLLGEFAALLDTSKTYDEIWAS